MATAAERRQQEAAQREAGLSKRYDNLCGMTFEEADKKRKQQGVYDMPNARIALESLTRITGVLKRSQIAEVLGEINEVELFIYAATNALKKK